MKMPPCRDVRVKGEGGDAYKVEDVDVECFKEHFQGWPSREGEDLHARFHGNLECSRFNGDLESL